MHVAVKLCQCNCRRRWRHAALRYADLVPSCGAPAAAYTYEHQAFDARLRTYANIAQFLVTALNNRQVDIANDAGKVYLFNCKCLVHQHACS
jgi:hypothetical protein